jgi:hypothetical protein
MARTPTTDADLSRKVNEKIIGASDYFARLDGKTPEARAAARRTSGRTIRSLGKRVGAFALTVAALIAATFAFGLIVGPIGWTGLFLVSIAILFVLIFFSVWPSGHRQVEFSEQLPTRTVIQQLDALLVRRRTALPAPAARRVDAISQQLPLLENRLGEVDALDPLAQDARRLMGKHLPELIERYERVPAAYRQQRDGAGMTVDERLVASLDAAREALDDIGARLAQGDLTAFETQGRFIESRYKDGAEFKGE